MFLNLIETCFVLKNRKLKKSDKNRVYGFELFQKISNPRQQKISTKVLFV